MTIPSLALGIVVAVLLGALFHLLLGGGLGRLFLYIFLSAAGSAAGQLVGDWKNWELFPVGTLNLGMVILGSAVFLIVGYWFSLVRVRSGGDSDAV